MNMIKNIGLLLLMIGSAPIFAVDRLAQPEQSAPSVAVPTATIAHVPVVSSAPAALALNMNKKKIAPEHAAWAVWAKKNKSAVQFAAVALLGYLAWSFLGSSAGAGIVVESNVAPACATLAQKPLQNPSLLLRLLAIL